MAAHATAVACILVGLDDVIEHAWPVPSPLDSAYHVLGLKVAAAVAVAAIALGVLAILRSGVTQDD